MTNQWELIPVSMADASAMPARSAPMLIVLATKKSDYKGHNQTFWKSLFEVSRQALPGHLADAGAHHLHSGHQRPGNERGPQQLGPKLRASNGIGGDAGGIIIRGPGNDAGTDRSQQPSKPFRGRRRSYQFLFRLAGTASCQDSYLHFLLSTFAGELFKPSFT